MPPFEPRNHSVTLAEASAHTRRHRDATRGSGSPNAHGFHADQVRALLNQPGVAGLRIYHGRNASNQQNMVLVATDANGNDLTSGTLLEEGMPCPPFCSDGSALNA